MAKDEKAPAATEKKKEDAAASGEAPKKKLPIKAAIVVLALLGAEGGGLFVVMSATGKPKVSAAAETADAEHGDADAHDAPKKDDGHGAAKKDDGHGAAKKDDGHGAAKKDDGHGAAKKDDGHGAAKKDDGHGAAKKDDGHGAKKEEGKGSHDVAPGDLVEVLVAKDRFPNNHTGRTWLWDAEIHVQVKGKHADRINAALTGRSAEIKTGLARIWRIAQHNHFNEPGLETLTRQVTDFLDSVLGATADGKSFIDRVLIPRCVGYPTEY